MTEIRDKNYSKRVPTLLPDTDTHFTDCNLLNCNFAVDSGNEYTRCLRVTKEYCSHLHPEYVEEGLPVCDVDCMHVIGQTEAIIVDGVVVVEAENIYADKVTLLDGTVYWEEYNA